MIFYENLPVWLNLYSGDKSYAYDIQYWAGWPYRGPKVDPSQPYICCLGNSFTFGRFVTKPYPQLLAEKLDKQVLNLGYGHLDQDRAQCPFLMSIINRATSVIIQLRGNIDKIQHKIIVPTITLNFDNTIKSNAINVPYQPLMIHYPDEQSHQEAACLIADSV